MNIKVFWSGLVSLVCWVEGVEGKQQGGVVALRSGGSGRETRKQNKVEWSSSLTQCKEWKGNNRVE